MCPLEGLKQKKLEGHGLAHYIGLISWSGNQQGLGNDILNSIGIEVGLVHTARNHCAERSGLKRTDANLSESGSMSDKVRRKRDERRRRRWVFENINFGHRNRHLGRYM